MKFLALILLLGLTLKSCKESSNLYCQSNLIAKNETLNLASKDSLIVYESENLIVLRLSKHIYEHISYLNTNDFGRVSCNGMLVVNESEGVIFDTPTDYKGSKELIQFVTNDLKCSIKAIIPTHFHNDCIGGIAEFEKQNITTYASNRTIELLKKNDVPLPKPIKGFDKNLIISIGNKNVYAEYFGEGHTKDNIVGYFPDDNAIFGGCLIKEVGASKGYLGDANVKDWSNTVRKVKLNYPNTKIVIPGHGQWGGTTLFDYTIQLFEQ